MRGLALATALAVALPLALSVGSSSAAADEALYLPAPTGHHPVGSTSLYLKDTSRPDPWVPSVPYRELMVSVFYPAAPAGGPATEYVTPAESATLVEKLEEDGGLSDLPPDLLERTRTHSVRDARPAGHRHLLPLVVLSPGYTNPRATLTALAEDLASHGDVVAVIGHTYENYATSFPDGHFTTCASCDVPHDKAFWAKLAHGRAADVSFVLDELVGPHPKWRGANLIDPHRIAMGGHSAGGGSAPAAMAADPRIRAGFDIDGSIDAPLTADLPRPFLFLGKYPPGAPVPPCSDPSWMSAWQRMTGWKRWLEVTDAQHASFTDIGLFGDELGVDFGADIASARVQEITRAYLGAFVDQALRGEPRPLLARPSPRYPEVNFCR